MADPRRERRHILSRSPLTAHIMPPSTWPGSPTTFRSTQAAPSDTVIWTARSQDPHTATFPPRGPRRPLFDLGDFSQRTQIADAGQRGINGDVVKPVDVELFTAAVRRLGLDRALLNERPWLSRP